MKCYMNPDYWYELRVAGSAGTRVGIEFDAKDGKAIGEGGRICSILSGQAKRFDTEQEALNYLAHSSVAQIYRIEVVLCGTPSSET